MVKINGMNKPDNSLQNALIAKLIDKKDEGFGVKDFFTLMELGEQRTEKIFNKAQELAGAMTPPPADEAVQEDGYDPKLGFLGNAGKSLFGGLKSLVEAAATNPQLQELLLRVVGTRQPSQNDLALAALRMENQFVAQPNMMYAPPQQPMLPPAPQHQQFRGPYAAPLPQPLMPSDVARYNSMMGQQPATPPTQQPLAASGPIQGGPPPIAPPAQQSAPATQAPVPAGFQTPANQQQAVANELEGATSGLPSNGDPIPEAPLPSNEELVAQELSAAVSATMEIALTEILTKPNERSWAEHAHGTWPKAFLEKLAATQNVQEAVGLIAEQCSGDVWNRITSRLVEENNGPERGKEEMLLAQQIIKLVDANKKPGAPK